LGCDKCGTKYFSAELLRDDDEGHCGAGVSPIGQSVAPGKYRQIVWRTNQRLLDTVVKVAERLVPTAVTAPIMTTAIRAAMRPYSIAVAPLSLLIKRMNVVIEVAPEVNTQLGYCRSETGTSR
jgi:hypothetical protein